MSRRGLSLAALCAAAMSCSGARPPQHAAQPSDALAAISGTRDLAGVWVEYWAPAGRADSQRFVFLPDGRFAWQASVSGPLPQSGATRRAGHFQLERTGGDASLVVSVAHAEQRSCDPCPETDTGLERVEYSPERLERYELGECAPNVEARAVDAHYACLAIAGHAFWRQSADLRAAEALLWP